MQGAGLPDDGPFLRGSVALTRCLCGSFVLLSPLRAGSYKNYSIPYFVYEKVAPCGDYPGDEIVSFTNITIEYDGKDVTEQVQWTTAYVDEVCDFAAKVINNPLEIQITWNTKAADPPASLIEASQSDRGFGLRRPAKTVGAGAAPAAAALA